MMAVRIEAGLQFCCCFLQDFEGNRLIGEMLDGTEWSSLFFVIRMSDDGGGGLKPIMMSGWGNL